MARKTTISKEIILESALKMLIRDGYQSINIKTLAAEIGCSTQPIAWHFENMEGLRKELAVYAKEYALKKASSPADNAVDAFEQMGRAYIDMAIDESNLFRFLYLGENPISRPYTLNDLNTKAEIAMAEHIAEETGMTVEQAVRCIRNTVIYSHGLAVMLATGVFRADENEVMSMIKHASESFAASEKGVRQ